MIDQALKDDLARLAAAPILAVACDYDGTLAPLAPSPDRAESNPRSLAALARIARAESTHAAVLSGRARSDLVARLGAIPHLTLIGGHGAEMPSGPVPPADPAMIESLAVELRHLAADFPGALVEAKPTGVALHYRHVEPDAHARVRELVRAAALRLNAPLVREGTLVVEIGLVSTDKGRALHWLIDRVFAHAAIFVGDDLTDEDAFAALRPADLAVKVGPEPSAAGRRIPDSDAVAELLESLADAREQWLGGDGGRGGGGASPAPRAD